MPPKNNTGDDSIPVPILEDNGNNYDDYKLRVRKWCRVSKVRKSYQATRIQLKLQTKAFNHTKHIPDDTLFSVNGVDALLEKLDELYIPDKLRHRIEVYKTFSNLKREENDSIIDHIHTFKSTFLEFRTLSADIPYDDSILALQLLTSCNIGEEDEKIVVAQMVEPPSSEDVANIMKRVFSHSKKEKMSKKENVSDIFLSRSSKEKYDDDKMVKQDMDTTHPTLYTRDNRSGGYRQGRRGRSGGRRAATYRRNFAPYSRNFDSPRKNQIGPDGQYRKCSMCGSIWHFYKNCPDFTKQKRESSTKQYEESQEVNLSFLSFVGCASKNDDKLETLLRDSQGYALLDSGCSNTVAGEEWMSKYIENLSVSDRLKIKVETSNESFTFGDGKTHAALRRITFPCWVGGKAADITTDIVDCKIPLLLSRKSMSKVGMIINFATHIATINNRHIKLKRTNSGHYALPISL